MKKSTNLVMARTTLLSSDDLASVRGGTEYVITSPRDKHSGIVSPRDPVSGLPTGK
jgi:hypothetical protein